MECTTSYNAVNKQFTIDVSNEPSNVFRARLLLNYGGILSYSGSNGSGIVASVTSLDNVIGYDDWNSSFRPPRIDSPDSNFNCEIDIELREFGTHLITLSDVINDDSASIAGVLVEYLPDESRGSIDRIRVIGNRVIVQTNDAHPFQVGESVEISNGSLASSHLLGPNGLRLCGNFIVQSRTDHSFTYYTKHYVDPTSEVVISDSGWQYTKWVAGHGDSYVPSIPSAAIPVNWDRGFENIPAYDHMSNTYLVEPTLDTYFTDGDTVVHIGESVLKCSGGASRSMVCMKFPKITMDVDYGQAAVLKMFAASIDTSEATLTLYQMDSNGWRDDMSYEEALAHVTQVPVSSCRVVNPALKKDNRSADTPNVGNYGNYAEFPIDSAIVSAWLSGSNSYSPSVAMKVVGEASSTVEFNSTDAGALPPYFVISGGEAAMVDPVPFDIVITSPSAEPGQVVRIEVNQPDCTFGNSLYDNVVTFNGESAIIMSGSPYYIDAVVPDTVAGPTQVMVLRKLRTRPGNPVQITNPASVYVVNDLAKRDVRLAEKKIPGEIMTKVSRSALYNRDLGFSNFTEITDETSLLQNVYSCLLTSRGERLFNQKFGTRIEEKIFTLGDATEETELLKECIQAVETYEPRVTIDPERSSCNFDEAGQYNLILAVILPTARTEMLKFTFKSRGRYV